MSSVVNQGLPSVRAGVGDEVAVADLQCHCLVGIGGGVAG